MDGWSIPFLDQLPSPLALSIGDYYREDDPFIKLHRLKDFAELLARFLGIVVVGEARQRFSEIPQSLRGAWGLRLLHPSFSTWMEVTDLGLPHLLRHHRKHKRSALHLDLITRLEDFWQSTWRRLVGSGDAAPERGLLALRNKLSHAGRLPESVCADLLAAHCDRFENAFLRLEFLLSVDILAVDPGTGAAVQVVGETDRFDPVDIGELANRLEPGHVYLRQKDLAVDLWPLAAYQAVSAPETYDLTHTGVDHPVPMLYSSYARQQVLEYTAFPKNGNPFARPGEAFKSAFDHAIGLSFWVREAELAKARQSEDRSWTYTFEDLTAELIPAGGLVGREYAFELVKTWIDNRCDGGGILWISGRPGVGKSALVAELYTRMRNGSRLVVPFFFRRGDARCVPEHFYRSAALRLGEAFGIPVETAPASTWKRQFHETLARVPAQLGSGGRTRGVVFLLDGLDEVAASHPEFLEIPMAYRRPGIVWVCAGRSERGVVEAFDTDRADRLWSDDGLPPLDENDVRQLVANDCGKLSYDLFKQDRRVGDGYSNVFVDRLVARSEGLPLYVRLSIEDVKSGLLTFDSVADLPQGLESYYERQIERLGISDSQRVLTDIVSLLCLAREALPKSAISSILNDPPGALNWDAALDGALLAGGVMLRTVGTSAREAGLMLHHDSFRQFLRETERISYARERASERLLAWCKRWQEHRHSYALAHLARHLEEYGESARLFELARSDDFYAAQLEGLSDGPAMTLDAVSAALETAVRENDAVAIAEFALAHAARIDRIGIESPIDGLLKWGAQRSWAMADLCGPREAAMWYLLIAWTLKEEAAEYYADVRATLDRLKRKSLPHLQGWEADLAKFLLTKVCSDGDPLKKDLEEHLLRPEKADYFDDSLETALGEHAMSLAKEGKAEAAIRTALDLDELHCRDETLKDVSVTLAGLGDLDGALRCAREIGYGVERCAALREAASGFKAAGRSDAAAEAFFDAGAAALKIEERRGRFREVASIVAELTAMERPDVASALIEMGLESARSQPAGLSRFSALLTMWTSVTAVTLSGLETERPVAPHRASDPAERAAANAAVALHNARAGLLDESRERFSNAVEAALALETPKDRGSALVQIGKLQADAGDGEGSLATIRRANEYLNQDPAYRLQTELARAGDWRQSGDLIEALAHLGAAAVAVNEMAADALGEQAPVDLEQVDSLHGLQRDTKEAFERVDDELDTILNEVVPEIGGDEDVEVLLQVADQWRDWRLERIAELPREAGMMSQMLGDVAEAGDPMRMLGVAMGDLQLGENDAESRRVGSWRGWMLKRVATKLAERSQSALAARILIRLEDSDIGGNGALFFPAAAEEDASDDDAQLDVLNSIKEASTEKLFNGLIEQRNWDRAIDAARNLKVRLWRAQFLARIASAKVDAGEPSEDLLREASEASRRVPYGDAARLLHLAAAASRAGFDDLFDELLEQIRTTDDRYTKYRTLRHLAESAAKNGDISEALSYAKQGKSEFGYVAAYGAIARVLFESGDIEAAFKVLNELEDPKDKLEILRNLIEVAEHGTSVTVRILNGITDAYRLLSQGGSQSTEELVQTAISVAGTLSDHGRQATARAFIDGVLRRSRRGRRVLDSALAVVDIGGYFLGWGEVDVAEELFRQAATLVGTKHDGVGNRIAKKYARAGNADAALEHWCGSSFTASTILEEFAEGGHTDVAERSLSTLLERASDPDLKAALSNMFLLENQMLGRAPRESNNTHFSIVIKGSLAKALARANRVELAEEVLGESPDEHDVAGALAAAYVRRGDERLGRCVVARACLRIVTERGYWDTRALSPMSRELAQGGATGLVSEIIGRVTFDEDCGPLLSFLARAYAKQGDFAKAMNAARRIKQPRLRREALLLTGAEIARAGVSSDVVATITPLTSGGQLLDVAKALLDGGFTEELARFVPRCVLSDTGALEVCRMFASRSFERAREIAALVEAFGSLPGKLSST